MSRSLAPIALSVACTLVLACNDDAGEREIAPQLHSSSLAVSPDGSRLYVVHPDADSVSVIDPRSRTILHERLLTDAEPARDDADRYEPAVMPRALALDSTGETLYVTGQRSGRLYALDATSAKVRKDVFVCSEPIGVLVSADDASVFVACSQDDEIVELGSDDLARVAGVTCPSKPWALAWAADGATLLATHLLGPGVSSFATEPLALTATWTLADGPAQPNPSEPDDEDPTEPHGVVRGIYDLAVRPGTTELWVAHLMLGIDTPQPKLTFDQTVFPALSILDDAGRQQARLSVQTNPGDTGAFGDIVSGPHALAFSDDGRFAFVVDTNSEDVLVIDAEQQIEAQLVRPLSGHMPEGVVWSHGKLYVQQRNSEDIAVFRVDEMHEKLDVVADGPAFASLAHDPMPESLRLGQKLFYSANSDDLPLTQNHWVACASCHLEGRSDAVTWRFAQGPRDTPTNAGGLLDTGFLFRTADRSQVQDYWQTINVEQGGHFSATDERQRPLLDALAEFVNYAIPTPVAPSTDLTHAIEGQALRKLRARGAEVFAASHCDDCHSGPAFTDSGAGNSALDLSGPSVAAVSDGGVLLHDVGTCVSTGPFPDVEHQDIAEHARAACAFDTPQLRGLWDSAPYLHDGSAATLADVLPSMLQASVPPGAPAPALSADDERALIEFLRSL